MWIDTDLNVKLFIKSFKPKAFSHIIDLIYYRFDHSNFSINLKELMQAFD